MVSPITRQTAKGEAISFDGNVWMLTGVSIDFQRSLVRDGLRFRSTDTDSLPLPTTGGRIERVNDYDAGTRTFTEFDAPSGGSQVGRTLIEPIPDEEIAEQREEESLATARANLLASADILAPDVLAILRYTDRRFSPDSRPASAFIRAQAVSGSVGQSRTSLVSIDIVPPQGLSGFILAAQIADSTIARFTNVVFGPAFTLNSFAPDPVSGPTLTSIAGTDIGNIVTGGEQDLPLFTLGLNFLAQGQTELILGILTLDDDSGNRILAGRVTATILVR